MCMHVSKMKSLECGFDLHPEIFVTVLGVTGGWQSCPSEHCEDGYGNRCIFLTLELGGG